MNLGKDLKSGFKWASIMQLSVIAVQFFSTITLSRLLTPEDFALVGMISIFVAFSEMIVDSGMGGALLKLESPSMVDYSTLFFYNFLISIFLYLILFFVAPLIANFYNKPILKSLIQVISLVVIINAVSRVHYVRLLKSLNYKILAIITFVSSILSLVIAILLAYLDYGVWCLVFQQIIVAVLTTILYLSYDRFIPLMTFSLISFKNQFSFGIYLLSSQILSTISENIHANILAKIVPIRQTGYFVQANRINSIPINFFRSVIDKTLFPIFAKINDLDVFKIEYRNVTLKLYSFIFPFIFLLIFLAGEIVQILLGNQWVGSADILSILLIGAFPLAVQVVSRNALKSLGKTKQVFINEIVKTIFTLGVILVTFNFGIRIFIYGIVVSQSIATLFIMKVVGRRINYSFLSQISDISLVFLVNLFSYLFLVLTFYFIQIDQVIIKAFVSLLQYIIMVIFFSYVFKEPQTIESIKKMQLLIVSFLSKVKS